jgi:hypothetical protein
MIASFRSPDAKVFLYCLIFEQKAEQELMKASGGIGKVFLEQVREREKIRLWKLKHLDPRKASRTPSADREPAYSLRFPSSVDACKQPFAHVDLSYHSA